MALRVTLCDDPAAVLKAAGEFLESRPVHHNLILSLLHNRVRHPEPGRYWIGELDGRVAVVVFQSPLRVAALITPMAPELAGAMANAIAGEGVELPGVQGEAASTAAFAGQWTESTKTAAVPFGGTRLYELVRLEEMPPVPGSLRLAGGQDRDLLVEWVRAYQAEVHDDVYDPARVVDRWIHDGRIRIWQDREPVSIAITRERVAGVTRIGGVFTPPQHRRQGYAAACVHAVSKSICDAGGRAILYTDLGNPTSNSIYRRLGYRAVAEGIRYRFE